MMCFLILGPRESPPFGASCRVDRSCRAGKLNAGCLLGGEGEPRPATALAGPRGGPAGPALQRAAQLGQQSCDSSPRLWPLSVETVECNQCLNRACTPWVLAAPSVSPEWHSRTHAFAVKASCCYYYLIMCKMMFYCTHSVYC